ncbi:MAG: DNA topoisomerase III, partial [Ruminococcaceae bacterium]|nr:DNA topoisomerase III [Oscillospiraceae bacterium]
MTLIIAEKPSLARNIVAGIGEMKKKNGYFEGCGYYVSWAFGHLFELCDIEAYSPAPDGTKYWTMDNLPCFPEEFRYQLRTDKDRRGQDDGVLRQFRVLEELCNRPDVDKIVNAGDADREGEIIVRTCVTKALKSEKPLYRLWLPDQTPETVAAALKDMKPEEDYRNLADEGYARTFIDWLYGVNLTRYATLKSGTLLRVGRVIVPIVRAIYDRDMAIKNFVPDIYYALVSKAETNGQVVELQSKTKFDKTEFVKAQNM